MHACKEFDVLNLASLKWSNLRELPVPIWNAQAALIGDAIYVGGGETLDNYRDDARLYIYYPSANLWNAMDTPVYRYALTTYRSQPVLIGGWEYIGEMPGVLTNKLWTLSEYNELQEILPPMPTERYSASAVGHKDHLIVAGGGGDIPDLLNIVEIYHGKIRQWFSVEPLPIPCSGMKSTVYNKHWYLTGGCGQKQEAYFTSLDSLMASCEKLLQEPMWKRLPNVPFECTSIAVFGNRLIVTGGELESPSSAINAYSPSSQSWVHVGEMPTPMSDTCTIALPSGELMVIGGLPESASNVLKMTVSGSGDFEMQLSLRDETIAHLTDKVHCLRKENDSTILILKEENEKLISELQEVKNQFSIKKGVKTELKEEAITMTKAETTSAQPTTGMPSHSITAIVCGASYMSTATWNLHGVEVCGEMTVEVHSSHYQQITWEGFGLKLRIPEGSLPAGVEKCSIQIRASLTGQYEFLENSHLVSAIFWLHCETVCKFAKPITVEIQHCAKSENVTNLKLSFVRAVCSQKQLPYTFKQLSGGNFTSHSSYGVIELKGFSGVAVIQEGSNERIYLASLLYEEIIGFPTRCIVEIYIVITWNTNAHHNVMIKHFKDAHFETNQPIEFESDRIKFIISNHIKKWEIKCLNSPVVMRRDVENFKPDGETSWVPYSKFKAKFSDDLANICDLECDVDVIGAKEPNNKFIIDITPRGHFTAGMSNSSGRGPSDSTRLTNDHLASVLQQLSSHAAKWRDIGMYLGFTTGELNNIEATEHQTLHSPESRLSELLSRWLQFAPGDARGSTNFATVEALKDALRMENLGAAAYDLH